jgi:NAD(P)-dependent dehydrogenase (short-subunit alcohol dehydrogenase family)
VTVGAERKAALVTGGSGGIGFGLVRALVDSGYGVTVVARQKEKLAAAIVALDSKDAHGFAADLRNEEEIDAAVAFHREAFGRLDVLVNNAGVATAAPIGDMTAKSIDLTLNVNLRSVMLMTRSCSEMLLEAAPSSIFNIASLAGLLAPAGMAAYSASKAGLISFTDVIRNELGPRGVKATAICPAFVDTAMSGVVHGLVEREDLIPVSDVVDVVMTLLRLSPATVVPLVAMESPKGGFLGWTEHLAGDNSSP